MNNIIKSLIKYAMDKGIIVVLDNVPPDFPPFFKIKDGMKFVFLNLNWRNQDELPFIVAHEISHALKCDEDDLFLYDHGIWENKYEYKADSGAVHILLNYYVSELDEIEQINVNDFMNVFNIPNFMYDVCITEIKKYVKKYVLS